MKARSSFSNSLIFLLSFSKYNSLWTCFALRSHSRNQCNKLVPFALYTRIESISDVQSSLQTKPFLQALISSRSSQEVKASLLEKLQKLRPPNYQRNNMRDSMDPYVQFLDKLVVEIEKIQTNRVAMINWPIPIPSYRVKLGSLFRIYKSILDEQNQTSDIDATEQAGMKRRALIIILNQLKTSNGVKGLEKECLIRLKSDSMDEMKMRTPDLETPEFTVVDKRVGWEVRQYKPFSVCSLNMDENIGAGAFNQLAGYIFGGNAAQLKMKMTTPVITSVLGPSSDSSVSRKMSFVMPSAYWNSTDFREAPSPLPDSSVRVEGAGGGLIADSSFVAVRWFGGYATRAVIDQRVEQLLNDVNADSTWTRVDGQEPYTMQYNDPFQPPWKRRNEVALPIRRRT